MQIKSAEHARRIQAGRVHDVDYAHAEALATFGRHPDPCVERSHTLAIGEEAIRHGIVPSFGTLPNQFFGGLPSEQRCAGCSVCDKDVFPHLRK